MANRDNNGTALVPSDILFGGTEEFNQVKFNRAIRNIYEELNTPLPVSRGGTAQSSIAAIQREFNIEPRSGVQVVNNNITLTQDYDGAHVSAMAPSQSGITITLPQNLQNTDRFSVLIRNDGTDTWEVTVTDPVRGWTRVIEHSGEALIIDWVLNQFHSSRLASGESELTPLFTGSSETIEEIPDTALVALAIQENGRLTGRTATTSDFLGSQAYEYSRGQAIDDNNPTQVRHHIGTFATDRTPSIFGAELVSNTAASGYAVGTVIRLNATYATKTEWGTLIPVPVQYYATGTTVECFIQGQIRLIDPRRVDLNVASNNTVGEENFPIAGNHFTLRFYRSKF